MLGNETLKMRATALLLFIALLTHLCGCALTKVVTVPLRVGGAVISVVPVVGNTADTVIDGTADVID
jgi:hypothetical protein